MPTVTLMCGPAGAGKTTHAMGLERAGAVRLSMDEAVWADGWRDAEPPQARLDELHQGLQGALVDAVEAGRDVVVDLSLASRAIRDEWRLLALRSGAQPQIVVLTAPFEVLLRRVQRRAADHANAVVVTEDRLRHYVDGFDWPGPDEPHTVINTA